MSNPPPYTDDRTANAGSLMVWFRSEPLRYQPVASHNEPDRFFFCNRRVPDVLMGLIGALILINFARLMAILIWFALCAAMIFVHCVVRPAIMLHNYIFGYRILECAIGLAKALLEQA
ncbi:hypothetical protein FRC11_011131 [Ceratobasidium sp. 423]|nr:hypothetical protein FRC11_011131 [Ceratobasidium sp. 423]